MSGFDCQFTEEPPKWLQCHCPICLLILREPYQVTCCGKSYCNDCIQKIKAKNNFCSTCKKDNFQCFPNLGLQQPLYGFRVFCSNKEEGCGWQGELGQLDQHLNVDPDKDKQFVGCDYTHVKCLFCNKDNQRCQLKDHQSNSCTKRPYSCSMCNDYKSTYEDVVTKHAPECKCRPVECPNSCGASNLQHQHLEQHVSNQCPLTLVECEFSDAGCDAKVYRRDLPSHLSNNMAAHVSLLARENRVLREKLQLVEANFARYVEDQSKVVVIDRSSPDSWGSLSEPFFTCFGHKLQLSIFLKSDFTTSLLRYTFAPPGNRFPTTTKSKIIIVAQLVGQVKGAGPLHVKHELLYNQSESSQDFKLPYFLWENYTSHDKFFFQITKMTIA